MELRPENSSHLIHSQLLIKFLRWLAVACANADFIAKRITLFGVNYQVAVYRHGFFASTALSIGQALDFDDAVKAYVWCTVEITRKSNGMTAL